MVIKSLRGSEGSRSAVMLLLPDRGSATSWIALYGAILASLNALWTYKKHRKDRAVLQVRAYINTNEDWGKKVINDQITFEMVNAGTRQGFIRHPGGIRS